MKTKQYLGLLLIIMTVSCRQPKALVYQSIQNFGMKQAGIRQTELSMNVLLFNPNRYPLKLKDADVDVFINGSKLGKMLLSECFPVPGLDTFSMPVTLNVDLKNVLPNALQLLMNPEVDITLDGAIKAGRHGLYLNVPVHYQGKQDLRSVIKF